MNTIKVTLPRFKGSSDPDEFLEWKIQSEWIFLTNNILETLKAKYALTQFEGYASTWWESKRRERESHHNYELPTWLELITLMEMRYLTPNYYQEVLKKVYMLRQGSKSVEEYYDEFENLRMKSKLEESLECTVIRFVANLRYDILKPLKLKHYDTLEAAFHDASKVEMDLKEEKSYKAKNTSTSTWDKSRDNWKATSSKGQFKGVGQDPQVKFDYKSKTNEKPQGGNYVKPTFPRPSTIQCFRCQGRGHVASECPNRRTIVALRDGYRTEDEEESVEKSEKEGDKSEEEGDASGDEEERLDERVNFACFLEKGRPLLDSDEELKVNTNLSCVVRRIMGALAKEELDQRENLFHARCKIQDKVCSLIIDSGSCTNVVSSSLVERMQIPTRKHSNPYKLQWLNESGEMKVLKQASIRFSVGKYNEELVCDVVPMLACHILLGRPWQFDRDVVHHGRSNKYAFVIEGKKYVLAPLTPYQVSEDYRAMKELRERIRVDEARSEGESSTNVPKEGSDLAKNKKNMYMIAKPSKCLKGVDEERFLMCLVNTNLLLHANQVTRTLPSIVSSLL